MSLPSTGSGNICAEKARSVAFSCVQLVTFFHVNLYPVGSRFLVSGLHISWQNSKDIWSKWKTKKEKLKSSLESDSFGCLW